MVVILFDTNVSQVKFADWTLCTRSCSLISEITTQELTPLSYKILCYFILNPNRIISRDEFVSSVWANHYVDDNAINKAISDLRRLLKATNDSPNLIKTHYKKGYSFICEVEYVYEDSTPLGEYSIDATSQATNEINISTTVNETRSLNSSTQSSQFLLGYKEKPSSLFSLKYFILIIVFLIAGGGATYWWQTQPKVLNLQSKKLSISDNSVYSMLSLSPSNDKLAVSKLNPKNNVDEIFLIDLETHKNTKIISEELDSYPIGWASNSSSIYYQIINNEQNICEIWRADFRVNNEVAAKEKVFDCESQYILSLVTDELSNRIIYTKFGYRNVPSLSALVARDLETGEEFQVTSPNIDSYGDRYVALSPKKDKVVFIRSKVGLRQIFVANLDGSMQELLYETPESIRRVSWSSDANNLTWYVSNSKKLSTLDISSKQVETKSLKADSYINFMLAGFNSLYGATRTSDNDIYEYDLKSASQEKLVDSRAAEFMPIAVKEGFYFFQEGEPMKLFSYFNKELVQDEISIDLPTFGSGDYYESSGLIALSYNKELRLIDPIKKKVIDKFTVQNQIVDLAWFNKENLLLVLESKQSEQHVWMFNLETEELQKIIHQNARSIARTDDDKILYQDFYNNFYLFDPQEGVQKFLLSLSENPYIRWKLHGQELYYSTGSSLLKYSLETLQETTLINNFNTIEKTIANFSVSEKLGEEKLIVQIQSFRNNEVILLNVIQ